MHGDPAPDKPSLLVRWGLPAPVIAALMLGSGAFLIAPTNGITGDTWFNLVFGRDVVLHGLPHSNTYTLFMHGAPWVNAQWGAHAFFYLLASHANFATLFLVRWLMWLLTFAVAASWAIRNGGQPARTAMLTVLGSAISGPLFAVRAQAFGELSFAILLSLLTLKRTWRRDAGIFVVLIVWCNAHGSVLLGIAATGLAALFELITQWKNPAGNSRVKWLSRVVGVSACVPITAVASPYGFELITSYKGIVGNPIVATYITEWARATPEKVPVTFVGLLVTSLALGFGWRKAATFPVVMLLVTAMMSMLAIRHTVFFGIIFAMAAPTLVDGALPEAFLTFDSPRFFQRASAGLVGLVVVLLVAAATETDTDVEEALPRRAAQIIREHAGTDGRVYASSALADWLLYSEPSLRGRIPFDARAELATVENMEWQSEMNSRAPSPSALAELDSYSVLAVSPKIAPGLVQILPTSRKFRRVFQNRFIQIYVRNP